jgi:hypothetical protein
MEGVWIAPVTAHVMMTFLAAMDGTSGDGVDRVAPSGRVSALLLD